MEDHVPVVFLLWQGMPQMIEDLANHFNQLAIHQSHADSVLQNSRAFCILLVHIPACPTKLNLTLNIDQDRALNTMAIELELPPDWFKIYCE